MEERTGYGRPTKPAGPRSGPIAILAVILLSSAAVITAAQEPPSRPDLQISPTDLMIQVPGWESSRFRFLPSGAWIAFDRPLLLSAAPGEERRYLLEVETGSEARRSTYVIDKRAPQPPECRPAGGIVGSVRAEPELSAQEGADIHWALVGPGSPLPSFTALSQDEKPILSAPEEGSASYTLWAYAVDEAGNKSLPRSWVFRLASAGLQIAQPEPYEAAPSLQPDSSLPEPSLRYLQGRAEVDFEIEGTAELLVSVNPASVPSRLDDYSRLAAVGGKASLVLSCPFGWAGELPLYYGVLRTEGAFVQPESLVVALSDLPNPPPAILAPAGPRVETDPLGRASFMAFPSFDGRIFVSVSGGEFAEYEEPVFLGAEPEGVRVAWYGEDGSGRRSDMAAATFFTPATIPECELRGVEEGRVVAEDSRLVPSGPALLRYELRHGAEIPPEPTGSSPLVGEELLVTCPEGEELRISLRYRAFASLDEKAAAAESKSLSFVIDKKPPEPPHPVEMPPAYSDRPRQIRLASAEEGVSIFASLSSPRGEGPFVKVESPIEVPGSDSGPMFFTVRAYAVDRAGNRSKEMERIELTIDKSSIYVDELGAAGGDGSPERPFSSLDAAAAAAASTRRQNINMRGSFILRFPVSVSSPLRLTAGFASDWKPQPSARSSIRIEVPAGSAAFTTTGSPLELKNLDLSVETTSPEALCRAVDGVLEIEDCSLSAKVAGDLVLLSLNRSSLTMLRSSIALSEALSCTAIEALDSGVSLESSLISSSKGVRIFAAIDQRGGSLRILSSLIQSSSDLGLRLISLKNASIAMSRSVLKADSGSGSLRLGFFSDVSGELVSSRFLLSWKGAATLFELEGGSPAFVHDSIVAETERGALRFFDAHGENPRLWNSIVVCASRGGELLRAAKPPKAGDFVANSLWGFDRLVAGSASIGSIVALDRLNAGSSYAARSHVSEPPERTFSSRLKGVYQLDPASVCVDSAFPLSDPVYGLDFEGRPRPSTRAAGFPDIGADELASD